MLSRLFTAALLGLIGGAIVALIVFIISALLPAVVIDASKVGVIAGIIIFLYVLVAGEDKNVRP